MFFQSLYYSFLENNTPNKYICFQHNKKTNEYSVKCFRKENLDQAFRKLSTWEIVNYSKMLFLQLSINITNYATTVKETTKNDFEEELQKWKLIKNEQNQIINNLQAIYQRKINKIEANKATGLWGKIQWYVFHYFFDQSKKIESLKDLVIEPVDFYSTSHKTIKQRIQSNITRFYELTQVPKDKRIFLKNVTQKIINQQWLRSFASDKFDVSHPISDEAKAIRTGIIELAEYLTVTKKLKEEKEVVYESPIEYTKSKKDDLKYFPVEEPDDEFVRQYEAAQTNLQRDFDVD